MNERPTCCELVKQNLSEFVDEETQDSENARGASSLDPSLLTSLEAHVEDCDACRDLLFDIQQRLDSVRAAGDDYVHPEDFSERVRAAVASLELPERGQATSSPEDSAPRGDSEMMSNRPNSAGVRSDDEQPADPDVHDASTPSVPPTAAFEWLTSRERRVAGAVMTTGLAALLLVVLWLLPAPSRQKDVAQSEAPAAANAGEWTATVSDVARAFGSDDGLQQCNLDGDHCRAITPGTVIARDTLIRTDERTRARLRWSDGSSIVLDRDTRLRLDASTGRHASLLSGELIADIAHDPASVATFELPHGRAEVLGTKFSLSVGAAGDSVVVSRGAVRLHDVEGRSVIVAAGSSGALPADGSAPRSEATLQLSRALSWGDREFSADEPTAPLPRGLGELRAKKPGEELERKGAVTLTRQSVKVRIAEDMARTEVHQTFTNHSDDVLEGIYRFPLPPHASIERLALEVDGHWEEGAFVDRERAAKIWRGAIVNSSKKPAQRKDDIVWVPGPWKDPALLEWQRGGSFELRIFPIPKRGERRIILTYTERLPKSGSSRRYSYPLPHDPSGTTRVADFSFDAQVIGHRGTLDFSGAPLSTAAADQLDGSELRRERLSMHERDFVPAGDIGIEFQGSDAELRAWAYRASELHPSTGLPPSEQNAAYVALSLSPQLPPAVDDTRRSYVLVVDRSRSMFGEQYRRAMDFVEKFITEMDPRDAVAVLACDSVCDESSDPLRPASVDVARRARSFLEGQTPEGASDLVHALNSAQKLAGRSPGRATRIVYVGDGTPTVGAILPGLIQNEVQRVIDDDTTLTAVTVGSNSDTAALRAATQAAGGVLLTYTPGQSVSEAAYDALSASYGNVLRDVRLELPLGLTRVAPSTLGSIAAGSEHIVVARMDADRLTGVLKLTGTLAGEPFERSFDLELEATSAAGNAFVQREYAATQIAELERQSDHAAKTRAIALSERFNVASRYTSLLVLESPAMFQAFGLDNQRTAAIWTGEDESVTSEGVSELTAVASGSSRPPASSAGAPRDAWDDEWSGAGGGVAKSAPIAQKPKRARSPRRSQCACDPGDLLCAMECGQREEQRFAPPPPARRRPAMVPMRRVWETVGTVTAGAQSSTEGLSKLEAALRDEPESRAALKALYAGYVSAGDFSRASELAERWSQKDPLDPDALTARADLAAQAGNRALAIRILGSVVDVRPGDHRAQWRLARAFSWANRNERSCRHLISVSQLRTDDADSLSAATNCARRLGWDQLASELRDGAEAAVRRAAESRAGANFEEVLNGEFQVEAEWEGGADDLDLVLLHPDGFRVSWLGAPTHAVISARDVLSSRAEGLALRGAKPGKYGVEVVRTGGPGDVVRGRLKIRFRGERRELPFVLDGERSRVAEVAVSQRSRLVPL